METAESVYKFAMMNYEFYHDVDSDIMVRRTLPTPEQAEDYSRIVHRLQCYYQNINETDYPSLTDEQAKTFETKRDMYESLHLDMRDVVFEEDGKNGLKSVTGRVLVPAQYDDFPELYDDTIYQGWGHNWCCPVVMNEKYGLVQYACSKNRYQSKLISECKYDRIYRYFGLWGSYFGCEINGRKGLLNPYKGKESIPCLQDEIYASDDLDGCVLFKRDGKFGVFSPGHCTDAVFDEIKIQSEDYAIARIGQQSGYIDKNGCLTQNRDESFFGSWYDISK